MNTTTHAGRLCFYDDDINTIHDTSPFSKRRLAEGSGSCFNLDFLKLLVEVAYYRYPDGCKQRLKLLPRHAVWFRETAAWYRAIAHSPILSALVISHKGLIDKPFNPYLRLGYTVGERLRSLIDHYAIFANCFDDSLILKLILGIEVILGRIETPSQEIYELTLSVSEDECREGELAIFFHKPNGSYLSVARFNLLPNHGGVKLYIAAIQGPKDKQRVNDACKSLSGLSPSRIVIEACLAFAKALNIKQVEVISDHNQVYNSQRNNHFSYDDFCKKLGGVSTPGGDYALPLFLTRKRREDTPRKRRAKYQRQHLMLDRVYVDILDSLNA